MYDNKYNEIRTCRNITKKCSICKRLIPLIEKYFSFCDDCKAVCIVCLEKSFNQLDNQDLVKAKLNSISNKI